MVSFWKSGRGKRASSWFLPWDCGVSGFLACPQFLLFFPQTLVNTCCLPSAVYKWGHRMPYGHPEGLPSPVWRCRGMSQTRLPEEVLSKLESQTLIWEVGKDKDETGEGPSQFKERVVLNSLRFVHE